MNQTLSNREFKILGWLATGLSYVQIRDKLNAETLLPPKNPRHKRKRPNSVSLFNVQATAWIIRKKTGLVHALDKDEARAAYRLATQGRIVPATRERNPKLNQPTPKQMIALRAWADGKTITEIALLLNVCFQSVYSYLGNGVRRAIGPCPPWKRQSAIREWFQQRGNLMDDPAFL